LDNLADNSNDTITPHGSSELLLLTFLDAFTRRVGSHGAGRIPRHAIRSHRHRSN